MAATCHQAGGSRRDWSCCKLHRRKSGKRLTVHLLFNCRVLLRKAVNGRDDLVFQSGFPL